MQTPSERCHGIIVLRSLGHMIKNKNIIGLNGPIKDAVVETSILAHSKDWNRASG